MKTEISKIIIVRLATFFFLVALLPLISIITVRMGFTSPEYLHHGVIQGSPISGMGDSVFDEYSNIINGIIKLTFGNSLVTGQPVNELLYKSIIKTTPILCLTLIFSLYSGLMLGIIATLFSYGKPIMITITLLACIPIIVLAYLILDWFYLITNTTFFQIFIPVILLSIYPSYLTAETINATLKDIIKSENAQFLRACGFSDVHALSSLAPIPLLFQLIELAYPTLLYTFSYSFFVEAPFGIPGFGQRFFNAVQTLDYPVIIGFSLFGFFLMAIIELIIAFVQIALDPRLKHD